MKDKKITIDPNEKILDVTPYTIGRFFGQIKMSLNDIEQYNADPELWISRYLNIPKEWYVNWKTNFYGEDLNLIRCSGITKRGQKCRAYLSSECDPVEWYQNKGTFYCHLHSSQETVKGE